MPQTNASPRIRRMHGSAETRLDAWKAYAEGAENWNNGRRVEAIEAIDRALARDSEFPEALTMAAFILSESGNPGSAVAFYRRSLKLEASQPCAWSNLGKILFDQQRFDEALEAFDAAIRYAPADGDAWNSRAGALCKIGNLEESERAAREALRLKPDFPEAALNLGNALLKQDRPEEALAAYRLAREQKADYSAAMCGEALALQALGMLQSAMVAFSAAEQNGLREAISGRGCLQLALGDFVNGWEGYEARWIDGKSLADALGQRFRTWRGPEDAGKRVLVLNDHGFGDTIQFARYLPLMRKAGCSVSFACPPSLHRLLSCVEGVTFVDFAHLETTYDAQIAISSLPHAFGTRLESIPAKTPYLRAEPALIEKWRDRIGSSGFRVGVVWQGNMHPDADRNRSFPLSSIAPLAGVPGVRLISLQKGIGQAQLRELGQFHQVVLLGDDFDSGADAFVDTAAAMMCLDLIVTCDTSIAHLAGALGRPVWVALKKHPEWRWLIDRSDSPWYPTMQLFRQSARGDWTTPFAEMRNALARLASREKVPARLISIPCAVGELIDKITILELKAHRAVAANQAANVERELEFLERVLAEAALGEPGLAGLRQELSAVNARLWDVEDELRRCEKAHLFDARFVELARSVYVENDKRAALKYAINQLCRSAIVEEKFYA